MNENCVFYRDESLSTHRIEENLYYEYLKHYRIHKWTLEHLTYKDWLLTNIPNIKSVKMALQPSEKDKGNSELLHSIEFQNEKSLTLFYLEMSNFVRLE